MARDIRATVGIIAYNSEKNIGRALASVQDFAEIILADGGSTDRTVEIAKEYGARIISQSNPGHPITDFARERNLLLDAATEQWFFHLDSDEIMTPALRDCIRSVAENQDETNQAYRIRYVKTSEDGSKEYRTYREYYQIRLVRTDIGARYIRAVHERLELPEGTKVGQTEAPWYVPLDQDDLSLHAFAPKAWKRTKATADAWTPAGVPDVIRAVCIEPAILIAKSFYKMIVVKLRWGRQAIPFKYELLRVLYSFFLSVRFAQRALSPKPHANVRGSQQ